MKIVPGSIVRLGFASTSLAVAMLGVAGATHAQSGNAGVPNTVQAGTSNDGATTAAGSGLGLTPGAAPAGSPTGGGMAGGITGGASRGLTGGSVTGGLQPAPAPNTMRANGTSLYMSPDPRAPNVSGRAAPSR